MNKTYRILAWIVAAEVVVQAATVAWFLSGLNHWITGGGTLDNSVIESEEIVFPEIAGVIVHGINGAIVVPLIGLVLLIVSFFAKVPGGIKWAVAIFLLAVVQGQLGYLAHDIPASGALHGVNALVLFAVAVTAARRARRPVPADQPAVATTV
jgi:hypothetical protein